MLILEFYSDEPRNLLLNFYPEKNLPSFSHEPDFFFHSRQREKRNLSIYRHKAWTQLRHRVIETSKQMGKFLLYRLKYAFKWMLAMHAHTTNWMSSKIKCCWNTLHTGVVSFEKFTSDWLIFSCSISPEGVKCRRGAFRAMKIKTRQTHCRSENMLFCSSIQRLKINPQSASAAVYWRNNSPPVHSSPSCHS